MTTPTHSHKAWTNEGGHVKVTPADGYGERAAAVRMARSLLGAHQKTLGADKGCDTRDFVADLRISRITPHVGLPE